MLTRLLKMKPNLPMHVEHRLCTKWGYAVEKRVPGDFILFKKAYISDKPDEGVRRTIRASLNDNVVSVEFQKRHVEMTSTRKKQLEKECDNIVCFFPDPYSVPMSVRARLMQKMQKLTAPEAQFVLEYMDENFPAVDVGD